MSYWGDEFLGKKLPFFPAAFPDETIISQVARYHILRAHRSELLTYDELFQAAPFNLTYWVPPHLDRLANKLPGNPSENLSEFINSSTLLPLFQVFGKGGHAGALVPRRIVGESGTTHLCVSCLIEDMKNYGVPYIHRSHQIPGVTACWKHGTRTIDRCRFCKCPFEMPKGLILSPWKACTCGRGIESFLSAEEEASSSEADFAKFARDLLLEAQAIDPALLAKVYRGRILELGFRRGQYHIARRELRAAIQESYEQELLRKIDHAYRSDRMSSWLPLVNAAALKEVPLGRHLLFAHFLFRDAKNFLNSVKLLQRDQHCQSRIYAQSTVRASAARPNQDRNLPSKLTGIEMLAEFAIRNGYGLEELWVHQRASMKKLVKLNPDAPQDILARISNGSLEKTEVASLARRVQLYDRQADENLEKLIREVSVQLYANAEQPVKITKNRLLTATRGKRKIWPNSAQFPLACVALEQCCESQWHFYARRIIWMIYKYPEYKGREAKLVKLSKLESHKGVAVYRYFSHIDCERGLSAYSIISILQEMGIPKDWHGPSPEKSFYVTGRRYTRQKRSSKFQPDSVDDG